MNTPLGKSMTIFLLITGLAVVSINAWSLWNSWQNKLTEREDDARNLSVSLARQAQDAFLQVDITLADAVRQLRQNRPDYASTPAFPDSLKSSRANLHSFTGCLFTMRRGNG